MVVSKLGVSKEETAHIAELARLSLDEAELAQAQYDLSEIVNYVNKIASLNTDGVAPTVQPCAVPNVCREDVVLPSLSREEALANAPDRQGEFLRVPSIIEGEGADE
jgi:aspartyl-tRNA(Asn)/glutamyl-tRNA(Gln) amidotransferase subunit C